MRLSFVLACLLIASQLPGQDAPKGAVEGTVVDEVTGEPVSRANVMLSGVRSGKTPENTSVQTQADGRFRIDGLEPGNYYVVARKSGYVETGGPGGASRFQLTGSEQKTGLTLKLTPQGIVSGRVFDEEGEPVQGAQVQVLQRRKLGGKLRWMPAMSNPTNDRGEYRIANLSAGEFAVSATYIDPALMMDARTNAHPQTYATTYYPNGTDLDSAQAVTVQKGRETAGVDLRLRKEAAFRVRVRVEGVSAELLPQANVSLLPRDISGGFSRAAVSTMRVEPGLYQLTGVRAGSWFVQAQVFQQGAEPLMGTTPIEVTTADLTDVVVRVGATQQITGTFVFEGSPTVKMNWKSFNVRLTSPGGMGFGMSFRGGRPTVTEDGAFTVPFSLPGKYMLDAQGPRSGKTYLASVKIGNEEYLGKELDLTNGAPGAVKFIYRDDAATVSGKLEGELSGGAGQAGLAVLVPVETHLRRIEYMVTAPVRPDGSFTFPAIRPGEYLVCHLPGDYRTLAEEGEPSKESMDSAVRLKAEAGSTHSVQLKVVRAPEPK